jgi:hypothetical protein
MADLTMDEASLTAEKLLNVLDGCENYIVAQERLGLSIRNGLFQMALACRDNRSVFTVENIRSEFDATVTIREDGALRFAKGDDIQLLCGLPPPALRRARENFRSAVREALDVSLLAQQLIKENRSDEQGSVDEDIGAEH